MKVSVTRKSYITLASVLFMIAVWKLVSMHFRSDFILPPPEKAFMTTFYLFLDKGFLAITGSTILRGITGFVLSMIMGIGLGIIAGTNSNFDAFIRPMIITLRSVPVISFILLALIWLSPDSVPVFVAMLTMFPFICTNVTEGIKSVDHDLIEMAEFYRVRKNKIISEVYIPAIMPFIISGASSAIGIGWRAIIIGEVLSQPKYGIGTIMQSAQTFLNVDAVIAWTIVAVIVSYLFEKMIRWSEKKLITWRS